MRYVNIARTAVFANNCYDRRSRRTLGHELLNVPGHESPESYVYWYAKR